MQNNYIIIDGKKYKKKGYLLHSEQIIKLFIWAIVCIPLSTLTIIRWYGALAIFFYIFVSYAEKNELEYRDRCRNGMIREITDRVEYIPGYTYDEYVAYVKEIKQTRDMGVGYRVRYEDYMKGKSVPLLPEDKGKPIKPFYGYREKYDE